MGKILIRTEAELHTKVFRRGIPDIEKITATNGIPDAVFHGPDMHPRFVEYKVISGVPRPDTPITLSYLGLRPQQARFIRNFSRSTYLAVLIKSTRRVVVLEGHVVVSLGDDARWPDLLKRYEVMNVSVDFPHELENLT